MSDIKEIKKPTLTMAEEIEAEIFREKRGKLKDKLKEKYRALVQARDIFENLQKEYNSLKEEIANELN